MVQAVNTPATMASVVKIQNGRCRQRIAAIFGKHNLHAHPTDGVFGTHPPVCDASADQELSEPLPPNAVGAGCGLIVQSMFRASFDDRTPTYLDVSETAVVQQDHRSCESGVHYPGNLTRTETPCLRPCLAWL